MFLRFEDRGFELLLRQVAAHGFQRNGFLGVDQRQARRPRQFHQRVRDLLLGVFVGGGGVGMIGDERVRHDFYPAIAMIEHDEQPHDHEKHLRQLQVVARRRRERLLEITSGIVAQKTNRAAGEARQIRFGNETKIRHDFFQGSERVFAVLPAHNQPRIKAQKGIQPRLLRLLRRFEQKGVPALVQFLIGGRGRLAVGHEIHEKRNDIAQFGQLGEPFAGRDDGKISHGQVPRRRARGSGPGTRSQRQTGESFRESDR